jgi:flagellar basal body-associated protein FliL
MAELHVQKKRKSLIWLWLIILIILAAVGYYLYIHYYHPGQPLTFNTSHEYFYSKLI